MSISIQAKHSSRGLRVLITGPASQANVALAEWLGEFEGIDVVGIETLMVKALVLADTLKPDVVLLDLETAGVNALSSVQLLREIKPQPVIILLTQNVTAGVRHRCMEAGVALVCDKTDDLDRLPVILLELQK
jgi:DNA-binding NarL/FixJ family response regulator